MSMALALARAIEADTPHEEAIMEIPLSEKIAKKINIASGEDAGQAGAFALDEEEAWAWRAHEQNLNLGMYNGD